MDQLGKLTFKKLEEDDHPALSVFCNECDKLGYENNQSFKSINYMSIESENCFKSKMVTRVVFVW